MSAHPDVRAIATASTDASGLKSPLREQVDVVRVTTAPLRERRDDVAFLATRFLAELAREYGRPEKTFASDALAALRRYDWPGNVRALRNVVERVLLLVPADEIRAADLPSELGGARLAAEDLYAPFPSLADGLESFTRYFLARALRDAKGDVEDAARRAGVTVDEFRRRIG
jgi:DNA-binding NtrC family response regulator